MSSSLNHDQIRELLGAFAVDAVEPGEREIVLQHLAECDECHDEVDELRRAAAMFGFTPPVSSDDLWGRIESQLSPPATRPVIEPLFNEHRQPRSRQALKWAGSVAAALLLVVGGVLVGAHLNGDDKVSREQLAMQSTKTTGAQEVMLQSQDGAMSAKVVLMPDGGGYVLDSNLPTLPSDKTYQLWAVMGQQAVSAGVLGPNPSFTAFTAKGDVTAFAITEEAAGGVVSSVQHPMLSGVVKAS